MNIFPHQVRVSRFYQNCFLLLPSLLPSFLPSVLPSGPQLQAPDFSGHCQASAWQCPLRSGARG